MPLEPTAAASLALPRVMVAAPHGKSGKTVVVCGVLRALRNAGVDVQPFKKGPDYIDPGWHSLASGRDCRNLDSVFMDTGTIRAVLAEASRDATLSLIEGAMGFFDGSDLQGSSSSAELAKQTASPVVLVMDVTRMTRTAAALLRGCIDFDPDVRLAGVILNRVGGARHERRLREAIEHYCGIPVVGAIPNDTRLQLPQRYLGLLTSAEAEAGDDFLEGVAASIAEHVDLPLLQKIAHEAPALECPSPDALYAASSHPSATRPKVVVLRDAAFHFYYPENLRALERAGADLVFLDSMADAQLPPDAAGVYIGGGFPELFAGRLQRNASLRASIRDAIERGMPVSAECGGLMYLARSFSVGGESFQMVGAIDVDIEMCEARQAHGYSRVRAREGHPWLAPGTELLCHEHHHSRVVRVGQDVRFAYENTRGKGMTGALDGAVYKNAVAGYAHVNAIASPNWAPSFVAAARAFSSLS